MVLTGALDDDTAGLWTIKLRGGTAIVQEPADAMIRSMPHLPGMPRRAHAAGGRQDRAFPLPYRPRALGETVMLLNKLGEQLARRGDTRAAEQCFEKAREAHERAASIRELTKQNEELKADAA